MVGWLLNIPVTGKAYLGAESAQGHCTRWVTQGDRSNLPSHPISVLIQGQCTRWVRQIQLAISPHQCTDTRSVYMVSETDPTCHLTPSVYWHRASVHGEWDRSNLPSHPISVLIQGQWVTALTLSCQVFSKAATRVAVCWLLNVPATCECISGTDLLRQFYMQPHWDRSCRSNCPSHPVTVYWHRANQSQHWPYNVRRLAG